MSPPRAEPFLAAELRRFYAAAVRLARELAAAPPPPDREGARKDLLARLKGLPAAAKKQGWAGASVTLEEAQLAMAAVADRLFAAPAWRPLTAELLPAGDDPVQVLGERIDALVERADSDESDLARVYLEALALGIAGEDESSDGRRRAEGRRRSLLALITRFDPSGVAAAGPIFPDAYARAQRPGPVEYLPDLRRWASVLLAGAALLAILSYPVWRAATAGIPELVAKLLSLLG